MCHDEVAMFFGLISEDIVRVLAQFHSDGKNFHFSVQRVVSEKIRNDVSDKCPTSPLSPKTPKHLLSPRSRRGTESRSPLFVCFSRH